MPNEIDVIILSWNREADTIAAIDSALRQQGVVKRVLIVDQGSTPRCLAAIRGFVAGRHEIEFRELGYNVGVAAGRNMATRLGRAPYVAALDNDAVFEHPETLLRACQRFDADPGIGALAFRIFNYFTRTDDEMCWDYPEALRGHADREFSVTRFVGAGHAMRRDAFEAAGGYDEALFFSGEERDLCYRILNLGFSIRYVSELAVLHKVDPEARIRWDAGRYYYAVRNALYSEYKFGASWARLAKIATALTVKGTANGIPGEALRAIAAVVPMAASFEQDERHRLRPEVLAHIRDCERRDSDGIGERFHRLFQRLPGDKSDTARPAAGGDA